jgi:hypothetical protein
VQDRNLYIVGDSRMTVSVHVEKCLLQHQLGDKHVELSVEHIRASQQDHPDYVRSPQEVSPAVCRSILAKEHVIDV